ncbi:hypothetical protein [Spiroplasma endosymbiont of 'Nebria riversi']|uniref:hypothetical protein n=1 Tax=Spiroplasma endosymbiont of 'Nebria riversi' TaxID=2792084 RepID=UPI001C044F1F|nr:hypothetical protein [Spiroplasma endosymbiont of 'Nebria riversi']
MKILNAIVLRGLITLPVVGCSKKENKIILSNKNETHELNLKKGFVCLVKNRWKKPNTDIKWDLYIHIQQWPINMPNWIKIDKVSPINEKAIHSIIDNYHAKNESILDELTKLNFNIKYEEIENGNIQKKEIVNLKLTILKNSTWTQIITKIEGRDL